MCDGGKIEEGGAVCVCVCVCVSVTTVRERDGGRTTRRDPIRGEGYLLHVTLIDALG